MNVKFKHLYKETQKTIIVKKCSYTIYTMGSLGVT